MPDQRTALVTGATSGVGLATAARLASAGFSVIIHGPTELEAERAASTVGSLYADATVDVAVADLSSQAEVEVLVEDLQSRFGSLDVLVNNAAAVFDEWSVNDTGIERTFAVNHVAPYLLTRLLLPTLERSDRGRIVIVASEAHRKADWDPESLERSSPYDRFAAYARSKLANLLFSAELARRLDGSPVTSNAVHPGTVRTRLFRPRNLAEQIAMSVINLRAVTPETASDGVAWLATSPDAADATGGYYYRRKAIEPSPSAADAQNGFELWKLSAELTDLPAGLRN